MNSDWRNKLGAKSLVVEHLLRIKCMFIHGYIDNQVVNLCCAAYSIISLIVI